MTNNSEIQAFGGPMPRKEYPSYRYLWGGKGIVVQNAVEEAALEKGWSDTPAAFEPYKGPRPPKTQDQDALKWVDGGAAAGLSGEHRNWIKAQLMRADSSFWRSPDTPSAAINAMRQAFTGIARVLANAGILTKELLQNDIPAIVWDAAVAGGWYRFASETPQDIFPEQLGHYWVWRDGEGDWSNPFYFEEREWLAWLLENPTPVGFALPARIEPASVQKAWPHLSKGNLPAGRGSESATAPLEHSLDFTQVEKRVEAIAAYVRQWDCSEAALVRTAIVDPADLSKWKGGGLPAESDKKRRIELAIRNNQQPICTTKKPRDF